MRIGLVGGGFPAVRRCLEAALAEGVDGLDEVELVDIPHAAPQPVDVLSPLGSTIDGPLMDACGARFVQQFGVGVSGVDLDAARDRGIPVANVPGGSSGNATAVAELAVLLLLALLRRFEEARAAVAEKAVGSPMGQLLRGRTVAVLGTGDIGVEVARRLVAFGVHVVGIGRRDAAAYPDAAAVVGTLRRADDLAAALAGCDDLVVACPLTEATRGIVDDAALGALRPGGHLVNVGRGPVVDHGGLLAALRSGHLAGAGLDVTWTEPIDPHDELLAENVVVTPHVGGITEESYAGMARGFVANVGRWTRGEEIHHRVC
ncbi:NAD(P)-dependent oxidoreductase [Actinomycetospora sp. TBRC 11914]|uniref:NAD(P)-dependent oxidoreductase n=1 Tax=Actinomycetospora sp. TBRC 11914 TaxID=2729387 RepID=UPI00145F422E|nr:NAD(P)-dependent oxidoreductase [Actinomycetospora sp. TBRC 11914]NMO93342.1 NAD(P)-binding domain-containing protein [Actinomycetospora sp. TBRC 11914]